MPKDKSNDNHHVEDVGGGAQAHLSKDRSQDAVNPLEEQIVGLNLRLLKLELPDCEQEVVEQNLGHQLETFTCFGRLPRELRLMVWIYMLPRRRVVHIKSYYVPSRHHMSLPKLPVSLFVNHESRRHFLEHYTVFFQPSFSYTELNPRAFCLDPQVDLVRIDEQEAFTFSSRITRIFEQNPDCLAKISSIEIVNVHWHFVMHHCENILDEDDASSGFFDFFTGLKTLHLTENESSIGWSRTNYIQGAYSSLVKLAEFERPVELSREALPTIIIHESRRKAVRSDHDYLHDGAIPYPWNNQWPSILQPPQGNQTPDS